MNKKLSQGENFENSQLKHIETDCLQTVDIGGIRLVYWVLSLKENKT